jgi:cell division protein FtsB
MREFHNKKRVKRKGKSKFYSKLIILALIVVIVFLARGTYGVYQKSQESREKLSVSEEKLFEMEEREESISKKIDKLNTESGIEEQIRRQYDVAKEGEEAIVIIQGDEIPITEEEKTRFEGFMEKFKSIFR